MQIEILSCETEEEFRDKLFQMINKFGVNPEVKVKNLRKHARENRIKTRLCIVVDGPTLAWIMKDEYTSNAFFQLGLLASSVICCRVSPK